MYVILMVDFQKRFSLVLIEVCDTPVVQILKGGVSKNHINLEYRSSQDVSTLVKN